MIHEGDLIILFLVTWPDLVQKVKETYLFFAVDLRIILEMSNKVMSRTYVMS